jgi:hypothetical protein
MGAGPTRAICDAEGRVVELQGISEYVTKQRDAEQLQSGLARIRAKLWEMNEAADFGNVTFVVGDVLKDLGVVFWGCGVNVLTPTPSISEIGPDRRRLARGGGEEGVPAIRQFW